MKVRQLVGLKSAPEATGYVVAIDVLRAFTTAAYALAAGAEAVVLVKEVDEAFALKKRSKDLVLVGEVGGEPIPGFDMGNSPDAIARNKTKVLGKRVILRTSSGTQAVTGAKNAERIVLGSFVVADATAAWLKKANAQTVSLLADHEEDEALSDFLKGLLLGEKVDPAVTTARIRASDHGKRAMDPAVDWITPEDLECACEVDRFDFAMPVTREYGLLIARKERPVPHVRSVGKGRPAGPSKA